MSSKFKIRLPINANVNVHSNILEKELIISIDSVNADAIEIIEESVNPNITWKPLMNVQRVEQVSPIILNAPIVDRRSSYIPRIQTPIIASREVSVSPIQSSQPRISPRTSSIITSSSPISSRVLSPSFGSNSSMSFTRSMSPQYVLEVKLSEHFDTIDSNLISLFERFGNIIGSSYNPNTNVISIKYDNEGSVEAAIDALNNSVLDGNVKLTAYKQGTYL